MCGAGVEPELCMWHVLAETNTWKCRNAFVNLAEQRLGSWLPKALIDAGTHRRRGVPTAGAVGPGHAAKIGAVDKQTRHQSHGGSRDICTASRRGSRVHQHLGRRRWRSTDPTERRYLKWGCGGGMHWNSHTCVDQTADFLGIACGLSRRTSDGCPHLIETYFQQCHTSSTRARMNMRAWWWEE